MKFLTIRDNGFSLMLMSGSRSSEPACCFCRLALVSIVGQVEDGMLSVSCGVLQLLTFVCLHCMPSTAKFPWCRESNR